MAARAYTGSFSEDLAKTPGPGRYNAVTNDTYTRKAPAYSMLGRSYMPGGMTTKLVIIKFFSIILVSFEAVLCSSECT